LCGGDEKEVKNISFGLRIHTGRQHALVSTWVRLPDNRERQKAKNQCSAVQKWHDIGG